MSILITGASGYIGSGLSHVLATRGESVRALVRAGSYGPLFKHTGMKVFTGDILVMESLMAAMKGCRQVYHTAARVGVWAKDPAIFYEVNVKGTANVLEAAWRSGVEKIVFTSSCSVIGPSTNEPSAEDQQRDTGYDHDYDRSKRMAEDLVYEYAGRGMHIVIVSPSKVYGPGRSSHSLTANAMIRSFLKRKVAFLPFPATYLVCFAFIDDVINGHLLAMEKGITGEKYILGGINISSWDFFERIRSLSGVKGRIIQLPKSIIRALAHVQEFNHKITGAPVRFSLSSTNYFFRNFSFSSEKAKRDLGYQVTGLEEAICKTVRYLS